MNRLKALLAEYGLIAIGIHYGVFFLVLGGFATAIRMGFNVSGAAENMGTWGAAYLATKLTQPVRIGVTVALTPLVGRLVRKKRLA